MMRGRAVKVTPTAASVPAARRFVSDTLHDWGVDDIAPVTSLLASELVTNAILHAGTAAELRVELHRDTVRIEVYDESRQVPLVRQPPPDSEGGRGMQVVDALASR